MTQVSSTERAAPRAGSQPRVSVPNPHVQKWLAECLDLFQPAQVRVLDGSVAEKQDLIRQAVAEGVLIPLNQQKLPGCYLHRSAAHDVARPEHLTFVCPSNKADAGPNNNWMAPEEAKAKLTPLFSGAMKGRTM